MGTSVVAKATKEHLSHWPIDRSLNYDVEHLRVTEEDKYESNEVNFMNK